MKWITQNIQLVLMGASILASGVYALSGLRRNAETEKLSASTGHFKRTFVGGALLIALTAGVGFVPAGNRGVIFSATGGVSQNERPEGVTLMVPFFQRLHNVNVRTQVFEYESFVQTRDLQEVTLPLAVNYHVDPDAAAQLYQEVGHDYATVLIQPLAFQASTQAAGQINAADIARSRAELAASIGNILEGPLARHGITVEVVSVKDAVFDPAFVAQIKANEVALQRVVESERLVDVAANEAAAVVRRAQGDAEAVVILGDAESERINAVQQQLAGEAYNEWLWASRWNGQLPSTVLGESTTPIVPLP